MIPCIHFISLTGLCNGGVIKSTIGAGTGFHTGAIEFISRFLVGLVLLNL